MSLSALNSNDQRVHQISPRRSPRALSAQPGASSPCEASTGACESFPNSMYMLSIRCRTTITSPISLSPLPEICFVAHTALLVERIGERTDVSIRYSTLTSANREASFSVQLGSLSLSEAETGAFESPPYKLISNATPLDDNCGVQRSSGVSSWIVVGRPYRRLLEFCLSSL